MTTERADGSLDTTCSLQTRPVAAGADERACPTTTGNVCILYSAWRFCVPAAHCILVLSACAHDVAAVVRWQGVKMFSVRDAGAPKAVQKPGTQSHPPGQARYNEGEDGHGGPVLGHQLRGGACGELEGRGEEKGLACWLGWLDGGVKSRLRVVGSDGRLLRQALRAERMRGKVLQRAGRRQM